MQPTTFEQLQTYIVNFYNETWSKWYQAGEPQAIIEVIESDSDVTAKYFDAADRIEIPLTKAQVSDYFNKASLISMNFVNLEDEDWRLWKASLIHEMIHEFQFKKNPPETLKALQLFEELNQQNQLFIPKDKHPMSFYAAIADKADYFDLPALKLAMLIK